MTSVLKWLLSIPYLAVFTDVLKRGKTLFSKKSSFSTIHAVLLSLIYLSDQVGAKD